MDLLRRGDWQEFDRRHGERYAKIMRREMTLDEALRENEQDWRALVGEPATPRGAVDAEDALLRLLRRALSDARTMRNPHDPEVLAYWRDEIRAALDHPRGAVSDASEVARLRTALEQIADDDCGTWDQAMRYAREVLAATEAR